MPTEPAAIDPGLQRAARLLRDARHPIALTGAGLSVESGIPPFRGKGGLWTEHGEPPLDGWQRFLADPAAAWRARLSPQGPMRELWLRLEAARPNPGHLALVELERAGLLCCLVTQNVDDLHRQAGHRDLAEIHGNARLARCIECLHREPLAGLALDSLPPLCPRCGGIVKSDTVSFGEPIPPDVLARCREQAGLADCILVVGTSATVYPAAGLAVEVLERGGALIEVNPEETDLTAGATVHLPGAAAHVLPRLVDAVRATPARDRSRS